MSMQNPRLIVSIVRKGWGGKVLDATIDAGAHGAEEWVDLESVVVNARILERTARTFRLE